MLNDSAGNQNIAIGNCSMKLGKFSESNICIGVNTGCRMDGSYYNVVIGDGAGFFD